MHSIVPGAARVGVSESTVVSGVRTAVGAFGGGLKSVPVVELGALVMKDVLKRIGLRPVSSDDMMALAPDKLKGQGKIDLEKSADDYDAAPRTKPSAACPAPPRPCAK